MNKFKNTLTVKYYKRNIALFKKESIMCKKPYCDGLCGGVIQNYSLTYLITKSFLFSKISNLLLLLSK